MQRWGTPRRLSNQELVVRQQALGVLALSFGALALTAAAVPAVQQAWSNRRKRKGPAGRTATTLEQVRACCDPGLLHSLKALCLGKVVRIDLSGQGLTDGDLPEDMDKLLSIRKVNLSRNRFTTVPAVLCRMAHLIDLDMGKNAIENLPDGLRNMTGLVALNLMHNGLRLLPEFIGELTKLERLGLKSNLLEELPGAIGKLTALVELYITDNRLTTLPPELGNLKRLRKLQASFNSLRYLPKEMGGLDGLELFRVAVNHELVEVPPEITRMPRIAWLSLAGSAWCPHHGGHAGLEQAAVEQMALGEKLGDGASGDVFAGIYKGERVAVKVFRSDSGPDGRAVDELEVACFVDHPNLVKVLAIVREPQLCLVMREARGQPLAQKPNFESVLRCRWGHNRTFTAEAVLKICLQVSRALEYLHAHGIAHGDVYAHNVLVDSVTGQATLCDFGASFFYPKDAGLGYNFEAMEVRAFGIMLRDMAERTKGIAWVLEDLVPKLLSSPVKERPTFREIGNILHSEMLQHFPETAPGVPEGVSESDSR